MTAQEASRPAAAALAGLLAAALLAGCAAPAGGGGPADGRDGPVAAGSGAAGRVVLPSGQQGWRGTWVDPALELPAATFTDTAGRRVAWPSSVGTRPVTVVFFGYTHCPDICNTVLADVASALRTTDPRTRAAVDVRLVSTDPARDTPAVMRRYLDGFDPSFVGLATSADETAAVARALGIALGPRLPVGGGYEVEHGTQLLGFAGRQGRLVWREGTPVGDLRADLERLVATSPRAGS